MAGAVYKRSSIFKVAVLAKGHHSICEAGGRRGRAHACQLLSLCPLCPQHNTAATAAAATPPRSPTTAARRAAATWSSPTTHEVKMKSENKESQQDRCTTCRVVTNACCSESNCNPSLGSGRRIFDPCGPAVPSATKEQQQPAAACARFALIARKFLVQHNNERPNSSHYQRMATQLPRTGTSTPKVPRPTAG